VSTYPAAEVFLDGERLGTSPLETRIRPGTYRLVLRSEGFEDYEREVRIGPGGSASVERILIANPDDPRAREILARRYELALAELSEIPRTRGGAGEDWIEPLYPRGDVRPEDVTDLRIDVGYAWDAKGRLEVRANGRVLFSADFAPENVRTVAPVPEEAKAKLKPGDEFEWGFYPEKGEPRVARCRLVAGAPKADLVGRELEGQDPSLAALLRANALLEDGLLLAAYREAERLADAGAHVRAALAVMHKALEGMKLEETPLWTDLRARVDAAGD
jgi:hypothetical protein